MMYKKTAYSSPKELTISEVNSLSHEYLQEQMFYTELQEIDISVP